MLSTTAQWIGRVVGVLVAAAILVAGYVVLAPSAWPGYSLDVFGTGIDLGLDEPPLERAFRLRVEAPLGVTAQVGAPLVATREVPFNTDPSPLNIHREDLQWSRCRAGRCEPIAGATGRLFIPRCGDGRCDVGWRIRYSVRSLAGTVGLSPLTPAVTANETQAEGWCTAPIACPAPERDAAGGCAVPSLCQPLDVELLARYQPDLRLSYGEPWAPTAVDDVLADFRLERDGRTLHPAATVDHLEQAAGDHRYRLDIRRCATRSGHECYGRRNALEERRSRVAYGRVWRNPSSGGPAYALQYWYFYYFDAFPNNAAFFREPTAWQLHEGDWELIIVYLDHRLEPTMAAYSSHCSGAVRAWETVEKTTGGRPVAYVGLGSHAHFFSVEPMKPAPARCTRKLSARLQNLVAFHQGFFDVARGTSRPQFRRPPDLVVNVTVPPAWLRFPGTWGETNLIRFRALPGRWQTFEAGPAPNSPVRKGEWIDPLLPLEQWPSR